MSEETIFYVKVGRKYVPHSTYSSEFCDSFPKGAHLVICHTGGKSRRYNIDPAHAPMIAAGRVAETVISEALIKASSLQLPSTKKPLTERQQVAWENLIKELGPSAERLTWPSAREAAAAAVDAMVLEAEKLLENPAVKKSYDNFIMISQLTKDTK